MTTTTNERVRQRFEEGGALNEHDETDHVPGFIPRLTADPAAADLEGGEMWYRTDLNDWRAYDGTSFGTIGFTADA